MQGTPRCSHPKCRPVRKVPQRLHDGSLPAHTARDCRRGGRELLLLLRDGSHTYVHQVFDACAREVLLRRLLRRRVLLLLPRPCWHRQWREQHQQCNWRGCDATQAPQKTESRRIGRPVDRKNIFGIVSTPRIARAHHSPGSDFPAPPIAADVFAGKRQG
jgi:hypothetical protein